MTSDDLDFLLNFIGIFMGLIVLLSWKHQLREQIRLEIQFKFLELLYDLNEKVFSAATLVSPKIVYDRSLLKLAWESHSRCEAYLFNYGKYVDYSIGKLGKKILNSCTDFLSTKAEYEFGKLYSDFPHDKMNDLLRDDLEDIKGLYDDLRNLE